MIVNLEFGQQGLAVDLPARCEVTVIRKRPQPALADPQEALRRALRRAARQRAAASRGAR